MTVGLNTKLYTLDELAVFLNKSKTTVYRMVKTKKIRYRRVGNSIRFTDSDISDYLDKNCVNSIT